MAFLTEYSIQYPCGCEETNEGFIFGCSKHKEPIPNPFATHTLDGLRTAYSRMTYQDFLYLLDGRDDGYWQEHWQLFKEVSQKIGKLGTFFPILVNHGHELRKKE